MEPDTVKTQENIEKSPEQELQPSQEKKKKVIDMTTGSPVKNILTFAIPIMLSLMLQNLYNLGDALIVSLSRGADATTGINITGSINFMILGFSQGISAGFGIVISRYVGAKNVDKTRNSFATSIVLAVIISVLLTAIALPLSRPLLNLLQTDARYIAYSDEYIKALYSGIVLSTLYNLSDQVLRALGDSKTPLYTLIICAVLNIGLNSLLFITDLPVVWAGWATIISQGVSAIIGFTTIFVKFKQMRLKRSDFKFSFKFALTHIATGVPMAIQFLITASGTMFQQRAFNMLPGESYEMAQSTASKVDNIFLSILNGTGMATFSGQNYGAKRTDRLITGLKHSLILGAILSVVAGAMCLASSVTIARILLPGVSEEIYGYVFTYSLIQTSLYYFVFLVFLGRNFLQGVNASWLTMVGGLIELMMRIIACETFAKWFGYIGACFSNPSAWIGGGLFFLACNIIVVIRVHNLNKSGKLQIE